MPWLILFVAGLFEIGWAFSMKQSDGFTRLGPTILTIALMIASVWLLALSLRSLPLGTAYAVWTGIGVIGTALIGIFFLKESAEIGKILCIGLIVSGIVGLKLFTPA